jgi:hypothetical protein
VIVLLNFWKKIKKRELESEREREVGCEGEGKGKKPDFFLGKEGCRKCGKF